MAAETPPIHPDPDDDKTLCRLAVRHSMLTPEQAKSALSLKERERRQGKDCSVEEILRRKGWIRAHQLEALRRARDLLKLRARERPLVEEILTTGQASREEVDQALREQARRYRRDRQFIPFETILAAPSGPARREKTETATATTVEVRMESPSLRPPQPGSMPHAPCAGLADKPLLPSIGAGVQETESDRLDHLGKVIHRDGMLDLIVSHDGMKAYLRLKGPASAGLTVERLRDLLESRGVVYGVVEDHLLRRGLKQRSAKSIVLKVAQGLEPKPGRNAEIRYHLASEPLEQDDGGAAGAPSLKDRGTIPQVRKGDLLAEKIPRLLGVDGVDVFGSAIVSAAAKDESLLCGSGVSLSGDGLRATARVEGRAMFTAYGKLTVLEEHTVAGDVSFETGNVDFRGIVFVHGVVQDGFRVRCGSLVCNEIGRAEIDVAGDITVSGGILGARVRCQGDLTCVHIHASRVEVLGDVVAEKGIVDSKVKASGRCVVKGGTVAASLVYAKRGIEAAQIGHERSRPCTLAIGFDPLMERELEHHKEVIVELEAEAAKQQGALEEMRAQFLKAERRTGEIAQLQDRTLRERRTMVGMLEDAKRLQDVALLPELEAAVAELDASAKETEQELEEQLDMQDQLKGMIRAHEAKARDIERTIQAAREEIAVITSWGQAMPVNAAVKVRGRIHGGTSIRGVCAHATLKEALSGVSIREVTVNAVSGETAIRMTRLR